MSAATTAPVRAAVGLGSNLGDPAAQVARALEALSALPHSRLLARSSLYRNPPMGPQDQPDYVNAAALLETRLSPAAMLDALQAIERAHGRERGLRWGPRTLDLDLLLWGEATICDARLQVPHPGLHERDFVLYPLAEIDPTLVVPGRGTVGELAQAFRPDGLVRIEP